MRKCIILITLFLNSCVSHTLLRDAYVQEFHTGQMDLAENRLTQSLNRGSPNDKVWKLLDRATIRFAQNRANEAILDYKEAIEWMDMFNQHSFLDNMQKTLFEDGVGAYAGEDYEQILARLYFAFALLHVGDEGNAFALLRQCEELQQKMRVSYKQHHITANYNVKDNPAAKYIFGALLEKRKDLSNAQILYAQSGIPQPLHRDEASVIVVTHHGKGPLKVSDFSTGSQLSLLALELFLSHHDADPAYCSLTGIPIPVVCDWPYAWSPLPTFQIDGTSLRPYEAFNVLQAALFETQQKLPVTLARGAARIITRRAAVACMQNQDRNLGAIIDIGMLIANANTKADTRAWGTLPRTIELSQLYLPAGTHSFNNTHPFKLKAGDLCIIHVFNTQPGVIHVLIPERFKPGDSS